MDRLAGLIGPRALSLPGTIEPTVGYIRGQWQQMQWQVEQESYDALGNERETLFG